MSYHHYILKVDSQDSTISGNTNPIQITFNNLSSSHIERIILKNASIPNVFYNITEKNNKIVFESQLIQYTVIIQEGHYNVNTLINYFNNTTESINSTLTISFNSIINKFLFDSVNNTSIIANLSNSFYMLGLNTLQNFDIIGGVQKTGVFMCDLSGVRNIYVQTSFSKNNCIDTTGSKSYIANIPVDVGFGSMIHYTNQEQTLDQIVRSQTYSQNLNIITISLRDAQNNLLNMQNMHWEINFKVSLNHTHNMIE